jgi:Domain of unknown function (DUF4157)
MHVLLVEHELATRPGSRRPSPPTPRAPVVDLQRLVGNSAVTGLLAGTTALPVQRTGCGGACGCGGTCGGQVEQDELPTQRLPADQALRAGSLLPLQRLAGNASVGLLVQRSMSLSQPGDPVEREAEAMAEAVTSSPVGVQRKSADGGCSSAPGDDDPQAIASEEEAPGGTMMAKASGPRVQPLHPGLEASVLTSRGGGTGLPVGVRTFMEQRFGADFGAVRVHSDAHADGLNREIGAEAFTTGADIYFRAGRYAPTSGDGRRLIAHELTHVVQQRRADAAPMVSRYALSGFSAADEASMKAAIPKAEAGVKSCKPSATCVASAITSKDYVYAPKQSECGWTYPLAGTIKLGPSAFVRSSCCDLESTIAHEASHTCFYTEGGARKLECDCFACSCDYGKTSEQAPEGGDSSVASTESESDSGDQSA